MASIAVLVEALQQYTGTFLVVSHDRHFLDQIAQQVWRVEGGAVQTFGGTYSEYRWAMEHGTTGKVGAQHSAPAPPKPTSATAPAPADKPAEKRSGGPKTKEQKRAEAAARAAAKNGAPAPKPAQAGGLSGKQLERAHADLEARILEKETEKGFLESRMASPDLYDDPEAAAALAQSHAALLAELKELYAAWEQTAEQLVG
jgi:ATP-binding cassette subfamily F protein 3